MIDEFEYSTTDKALATFLFLNGIIKYKIIVQDGNKVWTFLIPDVEKNRFEKMLTAYHKQK